MCNYWIYDFCMCFVFFFKQKTAYDMRISDWSSDVCSSDLSTYTTVSSRQRPNRSVRAGSTTFNDPAERGAAGSAVTAPATAPDATPPVIEAIAWSSMFDVGEQITSGARQMKLPLTLPPSEAQPPRQMRKAPASRPKLSMSSAPSVADFENLK